MGGDGGSIATRADMVKTKGFRFVRNLGGMGYVPNTQVREGDERLRRNEARDLQLSTCALSQEPLRLPIVACRLGRLYTKEVLLSKLLEKSMPSYMKHVTSLRDVKECNTEINPDTHFLICPVSRIDIRSGIKASIVWPCGCIISDKALRAAAVTAAAEKKQSASLEVAESSSSSGTEKESTTVKYAVCPNCAQTYNPTQDLVPLLPAEEELEKLQEKVDKLLADKIARKREKYQKELSKNTLATTVSAANRASSSSVSTVPNPPVVAPCATSTKLRGVSLTTSHANDEEKSKKRTRDVVFSHRAAIDEVLGGGVKMARNDVNSSVSNTPAAV